MKTIKTVMILAMLLVSPVHAFSANLGSLRISLIEGDVQVKTPEAGDWALAALNGPLMEGDQVWVPEGGRAELQLNTGSVIRLDRNSSLQILSVDRDSSQFYLSQGHAYLFYDNPRGSVIQVDTPDASTHAYERAIFRIDLSEEYQTTDVAVYRGYVEAENRIGTMRINAGDMLTVGRDTNGEVAPMGPPDEWETWNKERNDWLLAGREASPPPLPPELRAYSSDFDTGGRWVEVPDYGNCWIPTAVGPDWAPYRYGRWVWMGGDYVWISDEPWGWAPYHYGRWAFVDNVGWCWVPPVAGAIFWSPGYVGWVRTGDYVAWVPLAPGEVYYGRGDYGPNSVNITTSNVNQVNVTNVYKNVYINNSVTVINRNSFATASPKIVKVNQNVIRNQIFTRKNISVGVPAIKPTKASARMSAKPVPAAKLPPQEVRNVRVEQLIKSRPFIQQSGRSVLNPGVKPKQMPVSAVAAPRRVGKGSFTPKPPSAESKEGRKPSGRPATISERPEVKPQERMTIGPKGGPAPGEKRQEVRPSEKKPAGPESGPAAIGEKPEVKPRARTTVGPEGGPAPGEKRQEVRPSEKKPAGPKSGPAPKNEKKPVKPAEGPPKGQDKEKKEEH
jgi:uncharacterized protein DUF6600/FecR-like protein